MLLCLIIALPFAASLCAAFLSSRSRNLASWLAGSIAMASTLLAASLYPRVASGEVVRFAATWAPQYGLEFSLRMDGLAWMFTVLVAGMGVLVVLYARYYMSASDPVPRFFAFLLAFMGSMLGVVLSGHLIQMVFFWELTSLSSFMLIAYWYHREDARRGARMSLIVTTGGGLALLLGVLVLGQIAGSYDLDVVLSAADAIRSHPHYTLALVLILVGVFTKSAQFPFHFWLPQAMAAPTPVSAYLHSATMVKAGVFLLVRLWPTLAGTDSWFWLVCGSGAVTLLLGAFSATFQRDMKGVLAYSTISHLGLITMLLGMNSALALVAAVFHIMNHATFKASLFMGTGIIDHETGTRDLRRLGGLRHLLPITALLATVAAGAMAGVPLLNGFLSKEMFFSESLRLAGGSDLTLAFPAIATIAGLFSVAYSVRFIHKVFLGPVSRDLPREPRKPTRGILVPSIVLVLACLLVGVFPERIVGGVLTIAARSVLGDLPAYELKLWHGFTVPLLMSFVALAGGIAFYAALNSKHKTMVATPLLSRVDAGRLFDRLNVIAIRGAGRLTQNLFSSRLQPQLFLIVMAALTAGLLPLIVGGWSAGSMPSTAPDPLFLLLWCAGCAGALAAAVRTKYQRFAALIMIGVAGLSTCLTFAWFSAPDLALTQLVVETVTLILILLGLRWLPQRLERADSRRKTFQARMRRFRDFAIAVFVGVAMAAITYSVLTRPVASEVGDFYVSNALELAGGRNVVNVILVDFRGFDTLGEISVVGIVAMIVYALLRRFRPARESIELPSAQRRDADRASGVSNLDETLPAGDLRIPAVLVRLLLPFFTLVSIYFLLRGHQAPGGGFVGGLVMATGLVAQFMVGGSLWVESRLKMYPLTLVGAGLLCAGSAGIFAWWSQLPFLTARITDLHLPLIGEVHLSSVLLFDLGVYLLVIGATVLMLIALAHQSMRSPRKHLLPPEPETR
jgi:multicomponent K+:H+ antiporter subunit A